MNLEEKKRYEAIFREEVTSRSEQIDPHSEFDWRGLTVGWAIAKGLNPEQANEFAIWLRYSTDAA